METVIRGIVVYAFLLLIFRVSGQRSLGQVTTFDFVLLLIIAETTQQALLGEDFSVTNAFLLIATLIALDIFLSLLKQRSERLDAWLEGLPLVIVERGKPLRERMAKARVDEADILSAARQTQGLERMDQIKYAVLERNGAISVIKNTDAD
ncbi:MAG TPA: YetF domain-containing protein [Gammaproteobacteria bacterium]